MLGQRPTGRVWIGICLGFATWSYALGMVEVAVASNTLYLAPPMTILIGWAFLDETPTPITLLGGLIVLAGVAVTARAAQRREPALED